MTDVKKLLAEAMPPHTRLILASETLLDSWGTRASDGRRITVEWGEQHPEGWYVPTFKVIQDGPTLPDYEAAVGALERLLNQVEDSHQCPLCMENMNDPLPPDAHHEAACGAVAAREALRRLRGKA